MSVRATRWLLFVALVLAMPFPILGPFGGLVPPVRLAILFGATAAVAATEGAAGPVPGLLTLLGVHLLASLGVAWGLAWGLSRSLAGVGDGLRRGLALAAVAALLVWASVGEVYETGFGRAPRANLFGVLR